MSDRKMPVPAHPPELEQAMLDARAAIERAERIAQGPFANLRIPPLLRAAHGNINAALGRPGNERGAR